MSTVLGSNAAAANRPFQNFSFFSESEGLWSPKRTNDYHADCEQGSAHAYELIAHLRGGGAACMLGYIVDAMGGAQLTGVEIGFFHRLASAIAESEV